MTTPSVPLTLDELPGPPGLPLIGNVLDIDAAGPMEGFARMAGQYGPIYKFNVPGGVRVFVSGPELVAEVCDDERFDKLVGGGLASLRAAGAGAGLFIADTADPLWHRAHSILMAPFSLQAMRDYMPDMLDIADQLMDKWARLNPGEAVDVPADMTRLTLDTIALCGFGYRFNSFYRDSMHPYIEAMMRTLEESQTRTRQLPIQTRLRVRAQRQVEEAQAYMNTLVDRLVAERRAALDAAGGDPGNTTDLLGRMITGVDRQTGERLPDENIRDQCNTFLVAGHETTSGLLSFAVYFLLKHPDTMRRARAEVDEVLGTTASPTFEQVQRLTYIRQVLDEALRLYPTAPGFIRQPYEDTVIGGRYAIPAGTPITVLSQALHRDTGVWGPDAAEFNPEHTAPQRMAALPPHAYKPFGTGQRACIGRQFALQEATLVLGMLLQRFELVDHLDYQLKVKTSLTIKPDDFHIQVRPRTDVQLDRSAPAPAAADRVGHRTGPIPAATPAPRVARHGTPLAVLFGSNLGTAESIATRLAREGTERGFAVTLGALDDQVDKLPAGGAAIVVCASYNGAPPDNATAFCRWLDDAPADAAADLAYTVFGCGNTQWAATYQAVPTRLDEGLAARGGRRVHPRGEGDAAGDFDAAFQAWYGTLWADLAGALELPAEVGADAPTGPRLSITLTNRQLANPVVVSYEARPARIRTNRELLPAAEGRSTRHIEVALPAGMSYATGDHLGVLPRNDVDTVRRVLTRFGLDAGQYITIVPTTTGGHTHLPVDEPAPLIGVLSSCVELQDVATRRDIATLARHTTDAEQRAALQALAADDGSARYQDEVLTPHRSVLDLVEAHPDCALPFAEYLDLLPPLRPRYYSISSSPLTGADTCAITTGVLSAPARSGTGTFRGVCSGHLSTLPVDGTVFAFVRPPGIAFRPPENPHLPMIMIGAGTGLAPFRGFLEERRAQRAQGVPVAPSLLFFGCRSREVDLLYGDELTGYQEQGLARVEIAFSRGENGRPGRYVQDAMLACADEVWSLLQRDAAVFVCGNANTMAPGVRSALITLFRDKTGAGEGDAQAWLAGLRAANRFVEDVWGG